MSDADLECWKCGTALDRDALPIGRRDECPACRADLHACVMCEFWDTSVARECREPVADEVHHKQRSNFCGYFTPRPGAHGGSGPSAEADAARSELESLFGAAPDAGVEGTTEEDAARRELDRMFGLDEDGER